MSGLPGSHRRVLFQIQFQKDSGWFVYERTLQAPQRVVRYLRNNTLLSGPERRIDQRHYRFSAEDGFVGLITQYLYK